MDPVSIMLAALAAGAARQPKYRFAAIKMPTLD